MEQLSEKELLAFHEECLKYKRIEYPNQSVGEWEQFMEHHGALKVWPDGGISVADANNYGVVDEMYTQLKKWRARKKVGRPVTPVDWAEVAAKKRDMIQASLTKIRDDARNEGIDIDKIPF